MINVNLLKLRKINQLSQEAVSEKIGVSRQAVAKWESGETIPDIMNCNALAQLYGVTIDDLLNFQDKRGLVVPPKGKHIFGTVTLGDRGQIVIPKKARTVFNLNPGDELLILGDEEQGIALVKADNFYQMMEHMLKKSRE